MINQHVLLLVMTAILVVCYLLIARLLRDRDYFADHGIEAEARIVYLEECPDGETGTSYYPTVSFHANNRMVVGKPVGTVNNRITPETKNVTVLYDPYDPQVFVLKKFYRINTGLIMQFLVIWIVICFEIYK